MQIKHFQGTSESFCLDTFLDRDTKYKVNKGQQLNGYIF